MASSSTLGGEPSGSTTVRPAWGRWTHQADDGAVNSDDGVPLQNVASCPDCGTPRCADCHVTKVRIRRSNDIYTTVASFPSERLQDLSSDYEALVRSLIGEMGIEGQEVSHRFGLSQSLLREREGAGGRRSRSGNSDREDSSRTSIKQQLITLLGEKLSEYDDFLHSQELKIIHNPLRAPRNSTLCKFLLDGPSVHGHFEDMLWMPYSHAVRRLLLDPESRSWLEQDVDIFLDAADLMNTGERGDTGQEALRDSEQLYDEEAQNDEDPEEFPRQLHSTWRRIRTLVFNTLFAPLATAVCIFNITTALGYVILMNDPAPPKPSYIIGTLVTWFSTTGVMISHGILATGSMKERVAFPSELETGGSLLTILAMHGAW
ncbi:hypothetical protein F5882DRAFT_62035 [Hyaloscypha sp. PMI_1271]|nr:hypothetical protein F5882DRAFT_62035 [Hyaloscypha sp. PMI_1271]